MTKYLCLALIAVLAFVASFTAKSQNVAINNSGATADPSGILDVSSTSKGVLIPRMDKTQRIAITTPATGLLIYQSAPDSTGFYYYNGSSWLWLATASTSQGWLTTGNVGTDSAINFLGTLDNKPIMLRQNNLWMGQLNSRRHNYFIGGGSGQNNNTTASQNTGFGDSTLYNNTTAGGNTAIGYRSMVGSGPITGSVNTAMGNNALAGITTAFQNVAIGDFAMGGMQTGGRNVVIGPGAMENATKGLDNIALGLWALRTNDSSSANVAIGQSALYRNKRDNNVAIGYQAGYWNNYLQSNALFGIENTYVGYGSGLFANTGSQNVAFGHRALQGPGFFGSDQPTNTAYKRNVAIGDSALTVAYGSDNVAVGFRTLSKSSFTGQHTAVGSRALTNTTATYPNTAIGYSSMDSTTDGFANTAVGSYSFTANKTGFNNVAIGNAAMYQSTAGSNNTAVGNDAGRFISASQNTAIGSAALRNDTTGIDNVAVGFQASNVTDTASQTTAIGRAAMFYNLKSENTAVGYFAAWQGNLSPSLTSLHPTRNTENTAIGFRAMNSNVSGRKNVAVGYRAFAIGGDVTGFYEAGSGPATLLSRNVAIGDSAMAAYTGSSGVAIGADALSRAGFVFNNVAIGDSAMGNASTNNADENVAVGYKSLSQVRNQGNTAMGAYAGQRLTNTVWNTAIGYHALERDTTGSQNTVMGTSSFRNLTNGTNNVGVGINTGFHVTSSNNTFMGSFAGEGASGLSTGGSNTGVGYFALSDVRSAANNTAIGRDALRDDTSGSYNVAVGLNSMQSNLASDYNTAVGYNSLTNHKRTGFTYNTAVGASSLEEDSSGFQNTGVGVSALRFNKTGFYNTGVGINAGYYQKESYNTFVGGYSGMGERLNPANVTADTGNFNTGLGAFSMWRIANGSNNVALGYSALPNDSSGNLNTAVGNGALFTNIGSHNNQAFGWNALYSYNNTAEGWNNAFGDRAAEDLQTGTQNVVMGSWAFLGHNSGSFNTAVGNASMGNGLGLGGSNNTALGNGSLYNTTGIGNTAVGNNAGDAITTGTFNTLLGNNADVASGNLTNATAIGYNAQVAASNSLVLGASGTNVGINETSPNARLHIVRSGVSGGTFHPSSSAIIEDNTTSYLQLSNPTAFETGILSGNAATSIRSGIVFRTDSSIQFRSGGNTTAMTIDNTNFVGIGTIAPANLLHVSGGKVQIGTGETLEDYGAFTMGINSSFVPIVDNTRSLGTLSNRWTTVFATVGAINTSDARDKENISDLNYGLKELMKLRPVSFNWKENPQWGKKIGFIAQEVQPILGEVVQVGDLKTNAPSKDAADGTDAKAASDKLGIYYSDIIPVTVKAIQEQQQTIEQQQKQIEELKKKNEQLQKDMQLIKAKIGINN